MWLTDNVQAVCSSPCGRGKRRSCTGGGRPQSSVGRYERRRAEGVGDEHSTTKVPGTVAAHDDRMVATPELTLFRHPILYHYFLLLIARSTSRPASRALMVSRRSYCFFPFASASSTFAWPRFEK